MAKKKTEDITKVRSRNFRLLLYKDNAEHMTALDKIKRDCDYCAICHDKDIKQKEHDADEDMEDETIEVGQLKKEHYHVIIRFKNARYLVSTAKDLGIDNRFIRECNNVDKALEYLIHKNDADKHQYEFEEVFGTFTSRLKELLNSDDKTECEKVRDVILYINSCGFLSVTELSMWCAENGYWDVYRRSGVIFMKMLEEHNDMLRRTTVDEGVRQIYAETVETRTIGG